MAKYLISGGGGFIGSNIAEKLVEAGHTVRILDNFSTGKRENLSALNGKIELLEGDIRSYHIVNEAVDGIDYVLHQAALPSVPRSIKDPMTTNEVNIVGTLNMLQASRDAGVKRFVFASSSSIYGDSETLPKEESMIPNPKSPYAVSKLTGEYYCRVFHKIYGLQTIALRYFNVFGPKQDPSSQYSAVIPKFITSIKNGKPIIVYGDGEQTRDFTFIDNVISANILASTASDNACGMAFNVACNQRISLNEMIELLFRFVGRKTEVIYNDARPGDVKHSLADIAMISKYLSYNVITDTETGLKRIIDSY